MTILFLSIAVGDLTDNEGLYANLANEFKKQKHSIYVVAPTSKGVTFFHKENDISVLRVNTNRFSGVSNIKKGMAYQKMIAQYIFYIYKYLWGIKFDFILTHSLHPEVSLIVSILKKHYKCPYYLMQNDYTWQDAVSLGFFSKRGIICKYYQYLEQLSFNLADCIGVPSIGNINFLRKEYPRLNESKIKLLHLCQKPVTQSLHHMVDFRKKHNLQDKFIVVYGGSMGVAQKIEHVINLAESCSNYEEIVFTIIGKGEYLDAIKEDVQIRCLKNILFIDFLPQDEYLQLLSACDVGLIVLNEKLATPNFPSKTLSYFNLGIPILASIDYITDYGDFLTNTRTGLWSYSGDNNSFKANLLKLFTSPKLRNEFKENGYAYYNKNMLPKHACKTILSNIKQL